FTGFRRQSIHRNFKSLPIFILVRLKITYFICYILHSAIMSYCSNCCLYLLNYPSRHVLLKGQISEWRTIWAYQLVMSLGMGRLMNETRLSASQRFVWVKEDCIMNGVK